MANKFTNFKMVKEFLKSTQYPIVETETTQEYAHKTRTVNAKYDEPNHFFVTTKYNRATTKCEIYFSDLELVLDFKECEETYKKEWHLFVAHYLKGRDQVNYVRFLESKMIEELKETDRYFLDKISENPKNEEELSIRHDFVIKEILYQNKYLKELEYKLGLLHEKSYNPFAHPFFLKKEAKPRLVDIVAACNKRDREAGHKVCEELVLTK